MSPTINFISTVSSLLLWLQFSALASTYSLCARVAHLPDQTITLELVTGDKCTLVDSTRSHEGYFCFQLPENTTTGVYRILLGENPLLPPTNKPNSFDLIFNKENVRVRTNYLHPIDSMQVFSSEENRLWYTVLKRQKKYLQQRILLEKELAYYLKKDVKEHWIKTANDFNQLQLIHNLYLCEKIEKHPELLAAKIIGSYRLPLTDAFLSPEEQLRFFQANFFNTFDFKDEALINSEVYTDKAFSYLSSFNAPGISNEERQARYLPAVDTLLLHAAVNPKVYLMVKDFITKGFKALKMQEVIDHINEAQPIVQLP